MSKLTENIISGYGTSFAIRMDAEMGITGDYTDQFVLHGHCNSMPENELTNDYSIRRK